MLGAAGRIFHRKQASRGLTPDFPVDAATTARAVFVLLWRELDFNETAKVVSDLPLPLRELWP